MSLSLSNSELISESNTFNSELISEKNVKISNDFFYFTITTQDSRGGRPRTKTDPKLKTYSQITNGSENLNAKSFQITKENKNFKTCRGVVALSNEQTIKEIIFRSYLNKIKFYPDLNKIKLSKDVFIYPFNLIHDQLKTDPNSYGLFKTLIAIQTKDKIYLWNNLLELKYLGQYNKRNKEIVLN